MIRTRWRRLVRLWLFVCVQVTAVSWFAIESRDLYRLPVLDAEVRMVAPATLDAALLMLALGTPVVAGLGFLGNRLAERRRKNERPVLGAYHSYHPTEAELSVVHALGLELVGNHHIDLETLRRRFGRNPRIVTCVSGLEDRRKLLGYFILYPLTRAGYKAIMDGRVVNGRGIKDEYICRRFDAASALYIGMVGGVGKHAGGYAMSSLIETLHVLMRDPSLKAVFTRGATEQGIRVVQQFDMTALPPPSEIVMRFNNRQTHEHPRFARHTA